MNNTVSLPSIQPSSNAIQYQLLQLITDESGKAMPLVAQINTNAAIIGFWHGLEPIVVTNPIGQLIQFVVDTKQFRNITITSNGAAVIILQDYDPFMGQPVGPTFEPQFSNNMATNTYTTQTHFVFVTLIPSQQGTVSFWFN
ncbi:MAG: hypothetical protein QW752_06865 [Thermoplasmata archaeon]